MARLNCEPCLVSNRLPFHQVARHYFSKQVKLIGENRSLTDSIRTICSWSYPQRTRWPLASTLLGLLTLDIPVNLRSAQRPLCTGHLLRKIHRQLCRTIYRILPTSALEY